MTTIPVFRELLQNSDDAGSQAAEIHFNSRAFLNQKSEGQADVPVEKLPELKTAEVSDPLPNA